jgi:prepilin-type N-terminal cleavage/methylation domain-containing protein
MVRQASCYRIIERLCGNASRPEYAKTKPKFASRALRGSYFSENRSQGVSLGRTALTHYLRMQTRLAAGRAALSRQRDAFTLVEIMIAVSMLAVMIVSLYAGISFGFTSINLSRQKLRATQIALEKMEIVRMYSWEQINSNGFVPRNFTAAFFPGLTTNDPGSGLVYSGETIITNTAVNSAYDASMRMVTVKVYWTNAAISQQLEMSTYVSQYGLQRYIY